MQSINGNYSAERRDLDNFSYMTHKRREILINEIEDIKTDKKTDI